MDDELYNLIRKLNDESTFVQSEKRHLIEIFQKINKKSELLFQLQWTIAKQRAILDDLIFGRFKYTPSQYCIRFSSFQHRLQFVESHKVLGHFDYSVVDFLKAIRESPRLLAPLVIRSEKYSTPASPHLIQGVDNQQFATQQIVPLLYQILYGNCVLIQDEVHCLQLLESIMSAQFGASHHQVDPRRLIRKQSCTFNILFKTYITYSFSAQLFLIAALNDPISHILTQEWYLDIDPEKALGRFTPEEINNR